MSIRDWPAAERPREKLLQHGSGSLSDAELLAIFLRTGVSGKSAVDLARHLLIEFGSLRALLEADLRAFCGQLGLGPAKFSQLQAVLEISRRHLAERLRRDSALESPLVVRDYLKSLLRHEPHEVFGCLFLDSKHRMLAFEVLFSGLAFSNNFDQGRQRYGDLYPWLWGPDRSGGDREIAHKGRIHFFGCYL